MKRIKSRKEYKLLSLCKQKIIGKYFILVYFCDRDILFPSVGFTVSKKIGNAVVRNRVKRRIRAFLREYSPPNIQATFLCNIIALPAVVDTDWLSFKNDINKCLDSVFRMASA